MGRVPFCGPYRRHCHSWGAGWPRALRSEPALMKSWFKGEHRWRLPKHRATGPDGCCRSSANGFGAACGGIKTGRYGFMMLLSTSLAACLARRSLMMPDRQSGSCAQVRERGRRRFRSKGDQIQASPIIYQLGSSPPAAGLQSNGRDTSKSDAAKAFAAWGIYHSLASCPRAVWGCH